MFKLFKYFNDRGEYLPSDEPIAIPVGFHRPPTLAEQVARLVRSEQVSLLAAEAGMETFEESDDFDVDDDFEPSTPWERDFDLASIQSVNAGFTQSPDVPEAHAAKKRSKRFFKAKSNKPATSLPESPLLSPQGLASDEGASDSLASK